MSDIPACNVTLNNMTYLGIFTNWRLPKDEEVNLIVPEYDHSGFNELIIGFPMKDPHNPRWQPKINVRRFVDKILEWKSEYGNHLTIYAMFWAMRNDRWLRECLTPIKEICGEIGTKPVLDCEGDCHSGNVDSVHMRDEIEDVFGGGYIITGLDKIRLALKELAMSASLSIPQGYSIWKPDSPGHWSHSLHTFPGYQQVRAYNSWVKWCGHDRLVMGLSNYWGDRPATGLQPAITQEQSMMLAASQTSQLKVYRAWYWTLEFMTGTSKRAHQVRNFFGVSY